MKMRKLTHKEKKLIKNLCFKHRAPYTLVARLIHIDPGALSHILKNENPEEFKKSKEQKSSIQRLNKKQIAALEDIFHTDLVDQRKLAKLIGCKYARVRYFLRQRNSQKYKETITKKNIYIGVKAGEEKKKEYDSKYDVEAWIKLHKQGIHNYKIAEQYGVSRTIVSRRLVQHGYRQAIKGIGFIIPEELKRQILDYAKEGYYLQAISAKVKIPLKRLTAFIRQEFPDYYRIRFGGSNG